MKRVPQVKIIRRALSLTQEQFAERFHIPLGTLRDWEQDAAQPDQSARAFIFYVFLSCATDIRRRLDTSK